MSDAEQFVTTRARQMSGAMETSGMPAYPLFGLGQTEEIVWYRRPTIVFPLGVAVGFGLGYFVFAMAMPMAKNWAADWVNGRKRVKRNARKAPRIEVEGDEA